MQVNLSKQEKKYMSLGDKKCCSAHLAVEDITIGPRSYYASPGTEEMGIWGWTLVFVQSLLDSGSVDEGQ